jgi:3-methyladenine DNA glycosylase AlkD
MNGIILKEIYSHQDRNKAQILSRFFKTGKGQYGEGDIFLGLTVPVSRKIALKYKDISNTDISCLLKNKIHEIRLIALLILVFKYKKADFKIKKEIVDFYLKNTKYINNWDLVDLSAHHILGEYFSDKKNKEILIELAQSKNLWEQRIAIVSTFAFIRKGDMELTIKISKILINHKHDLIHKACGWMLREMGKRNVVLLCKFLDENINKMPRTMLRYSIEKFPENIRLEYLKKRVII